MSTKRRLRYRIDCLRHNMPQIHAILAREILDSRGRPTVEADVTLDDGAFGRAAVPSGASTGDAEAYELRDGDPERYGGLGVRKAVSSVNGEIARTLTGADALDQRAIDALLRQLDGTTQLRRLGANAVLAVSIAVCRAGAASRKQPLHTRIAELAGNETPALPLPMVNILSGGLHADRGMDVQDFLAIPMNAHSMRDAIEIMARVRAAASRVAAKRGLPTLLADEGGLSPGLATPTAALEMMLDCFTEAGLRPGEDVSIAVDVAATALRATDGSYRLAREHCTVTSSEMVDRLAQWARDYPVVSIEDGLHEEDWIHWKHLTDRLGAHVQLVGDDLFTTSLDRLNRGIREGIANGVLVKVNQNGTLSGTLDVIAAARSHGYSTIVSARSGETEDAFIADLAVGSGAGQIKIGSLRTSSTVSKYNQLLRIAEDATIPYSGAAALRRP